MLDPYKALQYDCRIPIDGLHSIYILANYDDCACGIQSSETATDIRESTKHLLPFAAVFSSEVPGHGYLWMEGWST